MWRPSRLVRPVTVGLFCVAAAAGAAAWLTSPGAGTGRRPAPRPPGRDAARGTDPAAGRPLARVPRSRPGELVLDTESLDDSGVGVAVPFTGAIRDPNSLAQLRDAIDARGKLGLAALRSQASRLRVTPESSPERIAEAGMLLRRLGLIALYEGHPDEASAALQKALDLGRGSGMPAEVREELTALLGIAALRRGEQENCIGCAGPSSCIFPIAREAAHQKQAGSREAIRRFTAYLESRPDDLRVRWALNLAYMTLGEYPEEVPAEYLVPLDTFRSALDVGRFPNVAVEAGLTTRGPNQAGGSVFDDFDGDGRPDLLTTSLDADLGASLFINRGDGTFEDRSERAGITDQPYVLNVRHADYDNDGDLDVLFLRGGWDAPMRMSLLRNRGDATFEDVTIAAGLAQPISSESAAWGDYDDDGRLDLFVCGEYAPPLDAGQYTPDPRNRCRLYHNQGDGNFRDVAKEAGLADEIYGKGAAWGDYDGDGRLDLYVSNMNGPSRLWHNEGGGKFRDVAQSLGVAGAGRGFACWFFDYDNDGRPDIYANEQGVSMAEEVAFALGLPFTLTSRPHLYRNLGPEGFRDVTAEAGLERPMRPMGCNIGDIDNDGYLDIYLGTGGMSLSYLVPNLMYRNVDGARFEDVTVSSGTGHLQKGHGTSFADYDGDGDLDLFVEAGGACPGDRSYNLLFRNPGHGRHWLKVKLVGTRTNRSAIGARLRAVVKRADGSSRTIHRTIGNNSSFGGNTLVESLGLGEATAVAELEVTWPTSKTTQTFRDLAADRSIEITEGVEGYRPLGLPGRAATAR